MLSTKGDPFGQATIEAMPVIMSLHQPVRTQTAVAGCPRSLRLVVRAEAQQSRGTIQKAREAIRCAAGRSPVAGTKERRDLVVADPS
jgi:hypothetical protein